MNWGELMYMRNASDGNEKVGGEAPYPLFHIPLTIQNKQTFATVLCSCSCE